jgi:hypothetical protein
MLELELAYNRWVDVSADWHTPAPLIIERGIEPGERLAGVGRMTFALHNPDGRYTPGHPACRSGFRVGIGARVRVSDGVQTATLFYGRLAEARPCRQVQGRGGTVEVVCEDDIAALRRARLEAFPLWLDVRPGQVVNRLIDHSFTPPGLFDYWRLDHPQAGALGQGTRLPDAGTGKCLDAGQSIFPWVGDTWPAGTSAAAAIADLCTSEGGFFFLRADGTPVFADRHARPRHVIPEAGLNASLVRLEAAQALRRTANRIAVTVRPREVSGSIEVLWQAGHAIRIAAGQTRTLICRYADPLQQAAQIGGQDVIAPVGGVDFTAATRLDGAGQDVTGYIRVEVEAGGSSARLTLTSRWPEAVPVYVHNLRLRGRPVRTFHPVTATAEDTAAQVRDGLLALQVDMPLQADSAVAGDVACALLANRTAPRSWITIETEAAALEGALARDIGDRLAVSEAELGLNGAGCFIEHIRHEVRRGGASHRIVWRTSPADWEAYWVLGLTDCAALAQGTRLGY